MSTAVWNHARAKGSAFTVLLAIADYANASGEAWPSVATIAEKARIDGRSVQRALRSLEAAGELEIRTGAGPYGTNLYRVLVEAFQSRTPDTGVTPPDISTTPDTVTTPHDTTTTPDIPTRVTPVSGTPGSSVTPPLVQVSPEPSLNRKEPSKARKTRPKVSLQAYLDQCQIDGSEPIPSTDAVWRLAGLKRIPDDLITLAWAEFKRRYLPGGMYETKMQKDWPAVFRKAVDINWYGLWWTTHLGDVEVTSKGRDAMNLHGALAAEQHNHRMAA